MYLSQYRVPPTLPNTVQAFLYEIYDLRTDSMAVLLISYFILSFDIKVKSNGNSGNLCLLVNKK